MAQARHRDRDDRRTASTETARLWLLGIVATILILAALSATRTVTLPLVFALFMLAIAWPFRSWVGRWLPPFLASVATFVAALLVVCAILGIFYLLVQRLVAAQSEYVPLLTKHAEALSAWLQSKGLPSMGDWFGEGSLKALATGLVTGLYQFLGALMMILILFLFGMPAIDDLQRRLGRSKEAESNRIGDSFRRSAASVQIYVAVTSLISLATGVLTGLVCLVLGIDLALVWAVLAFLLNYIPTIGSILAVVPPVLMALLQYGDLGTILLTAVALGLVEIVMGNIVQPKLTGQRVALRPVVILFALTLWGYIWGVVGALLATPITTTLAIFAANHERTRWIAAILSHQLTRDDGKESG